MAFGLSNFLAFWLAGFVALWLSGFLALWLSGSLAFWLSGFVALWFFDFLAVWLSGFLAFWRCDSLAFWLSGFVTLWFFVFLAVWLSGLVASWFPVLVAFSFFFLNIFGFLWLSECLAFLLSVLLFSFTCLFVSSCLISRVSFFCSYRSFQRYSCSVFQLLIFGLHSAECRPALRDSIHRKIWPGYLGRQVLLVRYADMNLCRDVVQRFLGILAPRG